MKCVHCGEDLKEGSLFCSRCGKEVQIVPDYNEYDEDYLKDVLAEANRPKSKKETQPTKTDIQRKKKKTQIYILIGVAVAIVAVVVAVLLVNSNVKKQQANSFDYQMEQAKAAYESGDVQAAISYYENALSLDSDNIEVRLILADIYMDLGDRGSALVLCQEIIQQDHANRRACEILIEIYEGQKNYDAVLSLFETVDDSLSELFAAYIVTAPTFSLAAGTYDAFQTVELATDGNFEIYYSLDGSDPMLRGERYTMPIELKENLKTYTVTAVCMNDKGIYSEVVSQEYKIDIPAPDMPIVTPDGGDFGVETTITITVPDGCSAYYTWDGSDPSINSIAYTGPFAVIEGNNVLSVIIIDNTTELCSDIYRGNYIFYPDDDEGEEILDQPSDPDEQTAD